MCIVSIYLLKYNTNKVRCKSVNWPDSQKENICINITLVENDTMSRLMKNKGHQSFLSPSIIMPYLFPTSIHCPNSEYLKLTLPVWKSKSGPMIIYFLLGCLIRVNEFLVNVLTLIMTLCQHPKRYYYFTKEYFLCPCYLLTTLEIMSLCRV